MSPEQVKGEELDSRSDIFSFGAVIYELLSGRQPFTAGSTAEIFSAILTREPRPLQRFTASVPEELQRIVGKCLEKDRERRYQSARELVADLRDLQRETDRRALPAESPSRRPRRMRSAAVVVFILLMLVVGGFYWFSTRGTAISSVAVLPFANLDADPETEYLSDGITDNIIERLSQLPDLRVMSHSAVFRYKGRESDARIVGRELGVKAVLTGRLVKRNDALTINLELVDADDNSHIWGDKYERKLADLLALQQEIPLDISEKLRLKLSGEAKQRLAKRYTENSEAYQLYLKGRYSWALWTEAGSRQAVDYFQEAIKKDAN